MKTAVFDSNKIIDQLTMRAIERRRPLTAMLELTYRCNFNCGMCYVRMTEEQARPYGRMRTVEEWLDMARQLKEAGVLNLTLTGGECTRYPGFNELYMQLSQMGFRLYMLSNAGHYTPEQRSLFEQYPPHSVGITLYGGSRETYEAVTGNGDHFERVIQNIRFFQSIGVKVNLAFTIVRENVLDCPKVEALCRELGLKFAWTTFVHPHMRDAGFSHAASSCLSPAQRVCVEGYSLRNIEQALEEAKELEKELEHFSIPQLTENIPETLPACVGSLNSCAILWNGEMSPCISLTGNRRYLPFETGFEAAWQQMQADHGITFRTPEQCRTCALQNECSMRCHGKFYSVTGDAGTPSPELCQYTWLKQRFRPAGQEMLTRPSGTEDRISCF